MKGKAHDLPLEGPRWGGPRGGCPGPEHPSLVPGRRPRVPPAPRSAPVAARPAWEPSRLSLIYGSAENRSRGSRSISTGGCSGSNKSGKWARLEPCARVPCSTDTRGGGPGCAAWRGVGTIGFPTATCTNSREHESTQSPAGAGAKKAGTPPGRCFPACPALHRKSKPFLLTCAPGFRWAGESRWGWVV